MKRCEHNDYPTSCPFCRIAALEAELAANTLPCGHHHSLMLKSAETGDQLYCELCDLRDQRNDLEIELEAIQRVAEQYQDEAGTLAHELAQARAECERVRDALEMMYDKWENGVPSYEDPDELVGQLGNAFDLTKKEKQQVLALIPAARKEGTK